MTHNVRQSRYDAVCRGRDELAAQVERLREAIEEHRISCDEECVCTEDEILWRVLDETPAQPLREIRAEAVEQCILRIDQFATRHEDCIDELREFAQQIRSGER